MTTNISISDITLCYHILVMSSITIISLLSSIIDLHTWYPARRDSFLLPGTTFLVVLGNGKEPMLAGYTIGILIPNNQHLRDDVKEPQLRA